MFTCLSVQKTKYFSYRLPPSESSALVPVSLRPPLRKEPSCQNTTGILKLYISYKCCIILSFISVWSG